MLLKTRNNSWSRWDAATKLPRPIYYLAIILAIAGWWALAFRPQPALTVAIPLKASSQVSPKFTFIDRDSLKQALSGDFGLMTRLIADWDIEAQILNMQGLEVQRLSSENFLRAQILGRGLGRTLLKRADAQKFLPQSYAAASVLLAIAHPHQLVALPKGMRQQTQLFPARLTDQIPLDLDRFNSEKLFLARPDLAFVSALYSHPAAIASLRNQGISIVYLKSIDNLAAIKEAIQEIGFFADRKEEAELLNHFIDAALYSIDNNLKTIPRSLSDKTLYLNFYTQLTTPSKLSFSYELAERFKLLNFPGLKDSMPIDQERLHHLNPDRLIISTSNLEALKAKLADDQAFQSLKAVQRNKLYFLDDDIQQAASQYAVLAYYDLVQALIQGIDE